MPRTPSTQLIHRRALVAGGLASSATIALGAHRRRAAAFRLAAFRADVTVPLGHPLMGGGIEPARRVVDSLEAVGFVLLGDERPIVLVAVDWCEIRGEAHDQWRQRLATAAGTTPDWVWVSCVHQHDAPIADLAAERFLREVNAVGSVCNPAFHEQAVERVADAVRKSLAGARDVTHLATGRAQVAELASNRRYVTPEGAVRFDRTSSTRDAAARAADAGLIDPWLRSVTFMSGDYPLVSVHSYAVHPMSYYGRGEVSADFVGLARRRRESEQPGVLHIYLSGCSGNVTAGKFNDGAAENRPRLADRLHHAMVAAWDGRVTHTAEPVRFDAESVSLPLRDEPGFTEDDLRRRLTIDAAPFGQCLAALGLSRRARAAAGTKIDLPLIDFGPAKLLLLPGEAYVEFQRRAAELRPDALLMVAGYGECGCGYVPTEQAWREGDTNLRDWCWVGRGSEAALDQAVERVLKS